MTDSAPPAKKSPAGLSGPGIGDPWPSPAGGPIDTLDRLDAAIAGDVRSDGAHRSLYATDASIYSEQPVGVVFPRTPADLERILELARSTRTAIIPRAAGTSLAGQVVGKGLVVDVGRHMNRILDLDLDATEVSVEPGVIQDELNRFLAPHGYLFGPDTSTSNRAMIGGMIGNNSCGSRSIRYGTTRDHVDRLDLLLSDGAALSIGPMTGGDVDSLLAGEGRLADIVRGLRDVVLDVADEIRARYPAPDVRRRNTGYALDDLLGTVLVDPAGAPLNLARLICGSEGTLALVTRATLNIEPLPAASGLLVAHYESVAGALEATIEAVAHDPSAVELLDKPVLDLTIDQLQHRHNRFFLRGDPEAILIIELYRESEEALRDALRALTDRLKAGGAYAVVDIEPDQAARVWAVRKAGLGLLMGIRGDAKPVAFIEDTAVAVQRLPQYIGRIREIMARHGTGCVYYGHASVGELHLRPALDLKSADGIRKLEAIATEVADLVAELGGSLSGEHGDGRVRSPYIGRVMGSALEQAFRRVKQLWDPDGLLNPGKIVDPEPVTASLRTTATRPTPDVPTVMSFERDDGLVRHVERCNGAGVCRKLASAGGTMCPSYMVTREEMHATRGRANLFRTLLWGDDPRDAFESEALFEAMSLCLQCKACKAECPASVDMAKLKSEFLQHYWDAHGTPLSVKMVGHITSLYRLGRPVAGLVNAVTGSRILGRWLRQLLGFDPSIDLPPLAKTTLRRWFARRRSGGATDGPGEGRRVALFVDEFTDLMDPAVGIAAVELLEGLGYEVILPDHADSGRPLISKGLLRAAAERAVVNVDKLSPLAAAGVPILGLEPSAALTLVDETPDLVPRQRLAAAEDLAASVQLIEDFLAEEAAERDLRSRFDDAPRRIAVHGHCHQKALVGAGGSVAALSIPSEHDVALIEAGCCGMAGSFGYEHRELSNDVAELGLYPAIRQLDDDVLLAAPGFSCRHQIVLGFEDRQVVHPVQILRDALR